MTKPGSRGHGFQGRYFLGRGRSRRIEPGITYCVRRHFEHTIGPLDLGPGARVLELGCGLGRFTELLLDRGFHVTAIDLSEDLVNQLRARLGGCDRLHAVAGPAEELRDVVSGRFDAVVGFFFLHHLRQLAPVLGAARAVLAEGGQIACCELNAFNPLVYLQVTFTPGMSWRGEPGVPTMRPRVVFPILQRLGFADCKTDLYGVLPPFISNTALGGRFERALEHLPMRPLFAYRVFSAKLS